MFKVLLIDDEPWVLRALEHLVAWEAHGCRIVGMLESAADIERELRRLEPDLILSDIRMPGISGLDMLRQLRARRERTTVVFLSAHSDFSYAAEALSLGAFDYLLKPLEASRLASVLDRARSRLEEESRTNFQLRASENAAFYCSLTEPGLTHQKIQRRLLESGFRQPGPLHTVLVAGPDGQTARADLQTGIRAFSDHLPVFTQLPVLAGMNRWLFLTSHEPADPSRRLAVCRPLVRLLRNAGLQVGLSAPFDSLARLPEAQRQATEAYRTLAGRTNRRATRLRRPDPEQLAGWCEQVRTAPSPEALALLIDGIPAVLIRSGSGEAGRLRIRQAVTERIARFFPSDGAGPATWADLWDPDTVPSDDALRTQLAGLLQTEWAGHRSRSGGSTVIGRILAELSSDCGLPLQLQDLAARHGLTPSYLSDLFRRETGETFTAHLTRLRMDRACGLLAGTDQTLAEISASVGYEDYFHFIKTFKKHHGMTPTAYRRSLAQPQPAHRDPAAAQSKKRT